MNRTDSFTAKGHVRIDALYEGGYSKLLWENHNTLTNQFASSIARLLGGDVGTLIGEDLRTVSSGTARWASYMKIGSGTTPAGIDDIAIEIPIQDDLSADLVLPISSTSYGNPFPGSATFISSLPGGDDDDEYNTTPLSEVGLFSESGLLLARQVHGAIEKTSLFQLQYSWTITFRS